MENVIYNWVISQLDCVPKQNDLTDVVVICHWRRNATTTVDGKDYFADVYGTQSFTQPSDENFTPYEELTYEQVCGWLSNSMDVEQLNLTLNNQLENQINPPIIVLPLPFVNP